MSHNRDRSVRDCLHISIGADNLGSRALEFILRVPSVSPEHSKVDETQMSALCATLDAKGVLDGLTSPDVDWVAMAIGADARRRGRENGAATLRERACNVLGDRDEPGNRGIDWDDRARVARALNNAADVVEQVVVR